MDEEGRGSVGMSKTQKFHWWSRSLPRKGWALQVVLFLPGGALLRSSQFGKYHGGIGSSHASDFLFSVPFCVSVT